MFLQCSFACGEGGVGVFLVGMRRRAMLLRGRGVSCFVGLPCVSGECCLAAVVADVDELFRLVLCACTALFTFSVVSSALFSCAIDGCWRIGKSLA